MAASSADGLGHAAGRGHHGAQRQQQLRARPPCAGGLYVNGDQTAATGATTVNNATLGGKGVIGGDVTLTGNSTLSPGDNARAGTLTIKGNLALGSGTALNYSFGQANGRRPLNDLTNVGGNVALGGKLNVALSPGGRFDVGIYRIINYGGTLSNPAGLTLGTLPAGANAADYFIQTSVDKQVNLAYTNGLTLNYWDGDAGPKNNNQVNGGAGTWVAPGGVNDNWTDAAGSVNAPWSQGAFAVFTGQSGTVRVDSTTNGPINAGHAVRHRWLCAARQCRRRQADPDRHAHGRRRSQRGRHPGGRGLGRWRRLYGHHLGRARRRGKLVKTDLGTLVLSGINTYTGGTAVNGGTLQVSQDSNMGALAGAVAQRRHAGHDRDVRHGARHHAGRGRRQLQCRGGHQLRHHQRVSGSGALSKLGTGTLILGATTPMPAARLPPERCSWARARAARRRAASSATSATAARWRSTAATRIPTAASSAARATSNRWAQAPPC